MRVVVGSDHAGFVLKEKVKTALLKQGIDVIDVGARKFVLSDDFPDYAVKASRVVVKKKVFGILFCGSAEGICIAANKVKGVRAVAVRNRLLAILARKHNDANVLCLAGGGTKDVVGRSVGLSAKSAVSLIKTFINTSFSGDARHVRRLKKIERLE